MSQEAVLIHGWDPTYYNSKLEEQQAPGIAWTHRSELINDLESEFNLRYFNLPGFATVPEPQKSSYDVEDYANELGIFIESMPEKPALILGYSFGGAVALMYKAKTQDTTPTILVSPAIYRGEGLKSEIGRSAKLLIPNAWISHFRHLYQLSVSEYYREGTPFLRKTYNTIVRRDLRPLLSEVDSNGIFLIYGENDKDTPWDLVKGNVTENNIGYHVIASGAHNIGQTHPREIVESIINFLNQNHEI